MVFHSGVSGTQSHVVQGLAASSHGRDIDGLFFDHTARTDSGGVFAGTAVLAGVDQDLDGVLAGHQVDDLEGVLDDLDGLDLFTGVAALIHEAIHHALDDGALDLSELLELVTAGGVGNGDLRLVSLDSNVIFEADVIDLHFGVIPFSEK